MYAPMVMSSSEVVESKEWAHRSLEVCQSLDVWSITGLSQT
jgi:hypothetical protein